MRPKKKQKNKKTLHNTTRGRTHLPPLLQVVVLNRSQLRNAPIFSKNASTSRKSSNSPFQRDPQLPVQASEPLRHHTRTKTKRRENSKSHKRWADHLPSVYRPSHSQTSHLDQPNTFIHSNHDKISHLTPIYMSLQVCF